MMRSSSIATLGTIVIIVVASATAHGQVLHTDGQAPSFEAATVKPWKPPQSAPPVSSPGPDGKPRRIPMFSPGAAPPPQKTDRVHFIGEASLLIASAYNLPVSASNRILGAPAWVYSQEERYELQGKIDETQFTAMQKMTAAQQHQQVQWMEQSLLADRFALKVHFETREMPVFVMTLAKSESKSGSKLTEATADEASRLFTTPGEDSNVMTGQAVTMDDLAASPLMWVGRRPVINQTGLSGKFDFTLKWTGDMGGNEDAPSIYTAMQEQLGLKLVPTKAPLEVVVIDRIERPTAN